MLRTQSGAIRVRKRPVEIEAMRMPVGRGLRGRLDEIAAWCGGMPNYPDGEVIIETLEGCMTAGLGDWVLRGVKGEFYPCKDDIFRATYELVEDDSDA